MCVCVCVCTITHIRTAHKLQSALFGISLLSLSDLLFSLAWSQFATLASPLDKLITLTWLCECNVWFANDVCFISYFGLYFLLLYFFFCLFPQVTDNCSTNEGPFFSWIIVHLWSTKKDKERNKRHPRYKKIEKFLPY